MKDLRVEGLQAVGRTERQARFNFVVQELATVVSPPPTWSVGSLGMYQLEFSSDHRLVFTHPEPTPDQDPAAWEVMTEDGEAAPMQYVPRLTIRKGLPWSFEVGGDVGWQAATRQFIVGGYGRWVGLDGWSKVPDLSIQAGYHGYVGNDQLEMGVFALDATVGYTFPARSSTTRAGSAFSPYGGYSLMLTHARPRGVDLTGVQAVSAWPRAASPGTDPRDFVLHRLFGGMEILTGGLGFRVGGEATFPRGIRPVAAVHVSFAARF